MSTNQGAPSISPIKGSAQNRDDQKYKQVVAEHSPFMGELEGAPSLFCMLLLLPRLLACHDQCVRPLIVGHVETIAQDIIEKGFALADGLIEFGIEIHIAAKHFFVVGS